MSITEPGSADSIAKAVHDAVIAEFRLQGTMPHIARQAAVVAGYIVKAGLEPVVQRLDELNRRVAVTERYLDALALVAIDAALNLDDLPSDVVSEYLEARGE